MSTPTFDEWTAELLRVESPPEGRSTRQLVKLFGINEKKVRELLRRWIDDGKITHTGFRQEHRVDGRACQVPVYRVVRRKK